MQWVSNSPDETRAIAARFYNTLGKGGIVALHGNLGAGKTCFTQGLAVAAGVREPVCSPTYTLMSEYIGDVPFHHIDLYRLTGPAEIQEIGFEEILEAGGITVIEWADRAEGLLPPETVHVRIEAGPGEGQRLIRVD